MEKLVISGRAEGDTGTVRLAGALLSCYDWIKADMQLERGEPMFDGLNLS